VIGSFDWRRWRRIRYAITTTRKRPPTPPTIPPTIAPVWLVVGLGVGVEFGLVVGVEFGLEVGVEFGLGCVVGLDPGVNAICPN